MYERLQIVISRTDYADIAWCMSIAFKGAIESASDKFGQIFLGFKMHVMHIFNKEGAGIAELIKQRRHGIFYSEHGIDPEQFHREIEVCTWMMQLDDVQLFAQIDVMQYLNGGKQIIFRHIKQHCFFRKC